MFLDGELKGGVQNQMIGFAAKVVYKPRRHSNNSETHYQKE